MKNLLCFCENWSSLRFKSGFGCALKGTQSFIVKVGFPFQNIFFIYDDFVDFK
ncbi:hypothetical protein LguiB_011143 [Lonicera macranthoides]